MNPFDLGDVWHVITSLLLGTVFGIIVSRIYIRLKGVPLDGVSATPTSRIETMQSVNELMMGSVQWFMGLGFTAAIIYGNIIGKVSNEQFYTIASAVILLHRAAKRKIRRCSSNQEWLGEAMSAIPAIPFPVQQLAKYKHDIQLFAEECVFTHDKVDKIHPIKKLPSREEEPYLYYIIQEMYDELLLALVKHRRMIITWGMCIVALHDAMFMEERLNALVSKKEQDSDELVQRCHFIWQHIPEDKLPMKPPARYKYTELIFPDQGSSIKGVAQGKDQLRQYTCSRVFCDEMAFWPACRDTFTALKPTLEGGGKACLVSTRYPGFFKNIIEDTIDEDAA